MANISFNVDAYTARLIGRENVSKLNGAVIELIKNTYDADASTCILYYEQYNETLYILDNGIGMNEEIIKKHWMTIGRSTKKVDYKSKRGRTQTGAKGIGRFALDRIADICEMFTASDEGNLIWKVNWNDFEVKNNITDVTAELYKPPFTIENFISDIINSEVRELFSTQLKETGTIFKLTSLRDHWNDKLLNEIKNDLMTLIPYERANEFKVYVFNTETSLAQADVLTGENKYSYDYKISFDVTENGNVRIDMHRNEFDFGKKFEVIMNEADFSKKDEKYFKGYHIVEEFEFSNFLSNGNQSSLNTIGKFSGVLYFEKQSQSKLDKEIYYYKPELKNSSNGDVFGGIRIYRDDFRVRPYGEPNNSASDWLLLSSRKMKSPAAPSHLTGAWRTTANQISGSIFISRLNISLPDQSNREGIVETKEFALFKEFITNVIQYFERDRQYVFRKLRILHEEKNKAVKIQQEIEEKALKARNAREVIEKESRKSVQKETLFPFNPDNNLSSSVDSEDAKIALDYKDAIIEDLEDENRLLRALATAGIVANSYIHEMEGSAHKIGLKIALAKNRLRKGSNFEEILTSLDEANEARKALKSWFNVTTGTVSRDKRRMKKVDLKSLITQTLISWQEILPDIKISYHFSGNEDIEMKCFASDIDSIFNNLITNSVASFEENYLEDKKIYIEIIDEDSEIIINYSDSGKGLAQKYRDNPEKILISMESNKKDEGGETIGTGMGMWILHRIVSDYSGEIDLSANSKDNTGFKIELKVQKE